MLLQDSIHTIEFNNEELKLTSRGRDSRQEGVSGWAGASNAKGFCRECFDSGGKL